MKRDWRRLTRLEDLLTPNLNRLLLRRAADDELEALENALASSPDEAQRLWASLSETLGRG